MFPKIHFTPLSSFPPQCDSENKKAKNPLQTSATTITQNSPCLLSHHYLSWSALCLEWRHSSTSILLWYTRRFPRNQSLQVCLLWFCCVYTFNPFSVSHPSLTVHITFEILQVFSCWATAEDIMFINIYSLLKGVSADVVALHTAWLQGSFSKAVPCCNLCSLLSTIDVVRCS